MKLWDTEHEIYLAENNLSTLKLQYHYGFCDTYDLRQEIEDSEYRIRTSKIKLGII